MLILNKAGVGESGLVTDMRWTGLPDNNTDRTGQKSKKIVLAGAVDKFGTCLFIF